VGEALKAIREASVGVLVFLNCQGSADHLFGQIASWQGAPSAPPVKRESGRMDLRTYGMGAQILRDLNVGQMRLLARPRKMPSIMPGFGLDVTGYEHQPPTRNK
jgi:3,4-dihydroxy 2-butanone 4-phosphate synthase/GTP cyclohydrolase II